MKLTSRSDLLSELKNVSGIQSDFIEKVDSFIKNEFPESNYFLVTDHRDNSSYYATFLLKEGHFITVSEEESDPYSDAFTITFMYSQGNISETAKKILTASIVVGDMHSVMQILPFEVTGSICR